MANAARITDAPTRAQDFSFNGCTEPLDEPWSYLEAAHGVLACLEDVLKAESCNLKLAAAAVSGAGILVHLAAIGTDAFERRRAA